MQISNTYGMDNLWELDGIQKVGSGSRYSTIQQETTPSGDTVSISDEAKRLFSEMIHKYDHTASASEPEEMNEGETAIISSGQEEAQDESEGASGDGAGGAGGAGGSSSDSVETLKKQLQSLKSQLASLASQAGKGADGGIMAKMNALQAQISALEAQINAAGA